MKQKKEKLTRPLTIEQREKILNKLYLNTNDIWLLIDGIGMAKANKIAKYLCLKMKEKKMYDPSEPDNWDGKSQRHYLINTELFKKEMRI